VTAFAEKRYRERIAMPSGALLQEINSRHSTNGTMNVKNNVVFIVTHDEVIAIGGPNPDGG
jgi:hypothetical protein